jgi:hypothetical protein
MSVRHATPVIAVDLPVLYEDEGQEEMGDSHPHTVAEANLRFALIAHFAARPGHAIYANLNLYYHPTDTRAYVSPDVMVVTPPAPLPPNLRWYRIDRTGPAPVLTAEVLSRRTFQQGDLTFKMGLYADLGIGEYLLADTTGDFLPERLLLKTLEPGGENWIDQPDQGRGVVSRFGFRVFIDDEDQLRVAEVASGRVYPKPDEADELAHERDAAEAARLAAEARVRELEAELARLRGTPPPSDK